jgi:hypothetical protein
MYLFNYIIKKLQNDNLDFQILILFEIFMNTKETDFRYKFKLFNDTINNIFLSNEMKNLYINHFCKIQNIYFSLLKFKNQYKFKKYKILID